MDTVVTILQVLLLVPFAGGGLSKLLVPYDKFTKMPFQAWANDFKPEHIKLIGFFEVAAVVGMLAVLLLPSLAMLAPIVAIGMALVMAGAIATHLSRSEYFNMIGNSMWLGFALFVAYGTLVGFTA
jgi:hypothetical protein